MRLILDTNIVFSTIAKINGVVSKAFFRIPSIGEFFAPDFLVTELQLHKKKLLKISGLTEVNYEIARTSVFGQINFIEVTMLPEASLKTAALLTKDIDSKDFHFVTLALFLDGVLWTGDKKLYEGLKRKGFLRVITTKEIIPQ